MNGKSGIETVHVVFKTHLDIGFTDLAENVIQQYVTSFIPKAIETAEQLALSGEDAGFVWTTGSWLINHYLNAAGPAERERMEDAIRKGYIAWHGLPFTTHTELLDESLCRYGLSIAAGLDRRFGRKTIAGKMTDVPGHTIGLVPLLAEAGIHYLHLGVNPASKVPSVPSVFRWRAADGSEVVVNYAGNYGEVLQIEGLKDVLVFAHTGDNHGPPGPDEIRQQFRELQEQFPGAKVRASTMDAFAAKLLELKENLPVVTEEIGDTWIHGAGTDPWKVAAYRELLRLRSNWIGEGKWVEGSKEDAKFSGELLMVAEHTWGMDLKKYLPDFSNYGKTEFRAAREADLVDPKLIPDRYAYLKFFSMNESDAMTDEERKQAAAMRSYAAFENSWKEQREYISQAVGHLPGNLKTDAMNALLVLRPERENTAGTQRLQTKHNYKLGTFEVAFGDDGSLMRLSDAAGKVWADGEGRTGLGSYVYETYAHEDIQQWNRDYNVNHSWTHGWADADFGKPGFEWANPQPRHQEFCPFGAQLYYRQEAEADVVIACVTMPPEAAEHCGAPRSLELQYRFPLDYPRIEISLNWFNKDANRLPEASWLSFPFLADNPNLWTLSKLGANVSPLHVVKNGARNLHACDDGGMNYHGADGRVRLVSLDAPLISPGDRRLFQFDNTFAPLQNGFHVCLHNNKWGTNFPMWYEEDAKFRFIIELISN
ncbi:hypothetical protein SY83_01540 [Paenibacillus swuensis]|uniref:Glycoside hydrolase n=1 Tax=Paenibacillus swuensis TaxID=1178515 RepID=A0A172TDW8_9BACL|nr:DUF5054 domain-containing protein [Paenibacillus swuensis]ANE45228.1 hypothetical protein SY83_01540 [Paenibacillus swuensis]